MNPFGCSPFEVEVLELMKHREQVFFRLLSVIFPLVDIAAHRDIRTEAITPCLLEQPFLRPLLPLSILRQTMEFVVERGARVKGKVVLFEER